MGAVGAIKLHRLFMNRLLLADKGILKFLRRRRAQSVDQTPPPVIQIGRDLNVSLGAPDRRNEPLGVLPVIAEDFAGKGLEAAQACLQTVASLRRLSVPHAR